MDPGVDEVESGAESGDVTAGDTDDQSDDDQTGDGPCPPEGDTGQEGEKSSADTASGIAAKQPDDDELAVVDDED